MDAVSYWANENGITAVVDSPPVLDVTAAKRLDELVAHQPNDPSELLRNRLFCRGGGMLLVGPTGVGKSSLSMQGMILWALGREAFGSYRQLRSNRCWFRRKMTRATWRKCVRRIRALD